MNLLAAFGLLVDLFTRAQKRGATAHTAAVLVGGLLGGVVGFFATIGAAATAGPPDEASGLRYIALSLLLLVVAAALFSAVWPGRVWQWAVILGWGSVAFGLIWTFTGVPAGLLTAVLGAVGVAAGASAGPLIRPFLAAEPRPRSRR